MSKYIGITIGPIVETMSFTSTPGGLWFSSYFFSTITRDLCIELQKREYSILTLPKDYKVEDNLVDNGVGTYHDRIYYVVNHKGKEEIAQELQDDIIECVIQKKAKELAEGLAKGFDSEYKYDEKEIDIYNYLKNTLQLHYVIFDETETFKKGIAKTLADALDGLELSQKVDAELSNSYLRKFVRGNEEGSNVYIKNYKPYIDAKKTGKFTLVSSKNKGEIKDLISIASNEKIEQENEETIRVITKTERYFAIIQADGDGMGQVICNKGDNKEEQEERIQKFSELCMKYTTESSNIIRDYGGVVIYAGGDDLLFLAPIKGKNNKDHVYSLCEKIGKNFQKIFQEGEIVSEDEIPSLSFGVSINYYKFPLYEAFQDARMLLFKEAKNFGEKNNIAVKVNKASGQTAGFISCMGIKENKETVYNEFINLLNDFYGIESENKGQLMHSVIYQIENQKKLFEIAVTEEDMIKSEMGATKEDMIKSEMAARKKTMIKNIFDNAFDNDGQTFSKGFREKLAAFTKVIEDAYKINKVKSLEEKETSSIDALTNMLRVAKFLVEGGDV